MEYERTDQGWHQYKLDDLRHVISISTAFRRHNADLESKGKSHLLDEGYELCIASWSGIPRTVAVPNLDMMLSVLDEFADSTEEDIEAIFRNEISVSEKRKYIADRYRMTRNVVELGMELQWITFVGEHDVLPDLDVSKVPNMRFVSESKQKK